jgi:hypothetical protein
VNLSSATDTTTGPQVGVDARGDAIAVWAQTSPSSAYTVVASQRGGKRGVWSREVPLSASGVQSLYPAIAVDARGDAVAVWTASLDGHDVAQAAYKPAGKQWEKTQTLSQGASEPSVALDAAGDATAVWVGGSSADPGQDAIYASTRPASAHDWRKPTKIAGGSQLELPQVALDAKGDAAVVWQGFLSGGVANGATFAVDASTRPASRKTWAAGARIGTEQSQGESPGEQPAPHVALDSNGDAIAVWQGPGSSGPPNIIGIPTPRIQSATKPHSKARWRSPVNVSAAGVAGQFPQLAVDPAGATVAVWQAAEGGHARVISAVGSAATGKWRDVTALSPADANGVEPAVSIDARGDATAIWALFDYPGYLIQTSPRSSTAQAWKTPLTLSTPGQNAGEPQLASNATGDTTAVWGRPDPQHGIVIQATGYTP